MKNLRPVERLLRPDEGEEEKHHGSESGRGRSEAESKGTKMHERRGGWCEEVLKGEGGERYGGTAGGARDALTKCPDRWDGLSEKGADMDDGMAGHRW